MAVSSGPRSVSDATRFTPTTPHATSKTSSTSSAAGPRARFAPPKAGKPVGAAGSTLPNAGVETPEQRVARLRAAHDAAKRAKVSRFDQVVSMSRGMFDSAHKITVMTLIGFTGIAFLATAYTAYDMMVFNKKRKAEFFEAQRQMEADSLEAARLAYMTNKATPEQVALVEEALEREARGGAQSGFKMPNILSPPTAIKTTKEEDGAAAAKAQETVSQAARWPGSAAATVAEEAKAALEREKQNQRQGGPLDRLGIDETQAAGTPKKRGWWPF